MQVQAQWPFIAMVAGFLLSYVYYIAVPSLPKAACGGKLAVWQLLRVITARAVTKRESRRRIMVGAG